MLTILMGMLTLSVVCICIGLPLFLWLDMRKPR